jgi:predicted Rossmann-fold nucleotide-binding protein
MTSAVDPSDSRVVLAYCMPAAAVPASGAAPLVAVEPRSLNPLPDAERHALVRGHLAAWRGLTNQTGLTLEQVRNAPAWSLGTLHPSGSDAMIGMPSAPQAAGDGAPEVLIAHAPPDCDDETLRQAVRAYLAKVGNPPTEGILSFRLADLNSDSSNRQTALPFDVWTGEPASVDPAQGEATISVTVDPCATAALPCLDEPEQVFRNLVLHGKADIGEQTAWVEALLQNMKDGGHLTQNPAEYLITPHFDSTGIDTHQLALAGDTVHEARSIKQATRAEGLFRTMVLGWRGRALDDSHRQQQLDKSAFIVLPKGDFHAVTQLFEAMRYLASDRIESLPEAERRKTLVIPDLSFYRPLLEALFGPPPAGADAAAFFEEQLNALLVPPDSGRDQYIAVRVLDDPQSLVDTCLARLPGTQNVLNMVQYQPPISFPCNVPLLFVGTSKEPKLRDWCGALANDGVELRFLMEAINDVGDPAEKHRTYVTNSRGKAGEGNTGKAHSFLQVLQAVLRGEHPTMPRETFLQRLKDFGVDAARGDVFHFLVDDRGFEVPHWDKIAPYFNAELLAAIEEEVEHRVGGQAMGKQPVPGVETTWWLNVAGGPKNLMEEILRAYDRYEEDTGETLPRQMVDVCVATLVEFNLSNGEATMQDFAGTTLFDVRRPREGAFADDTEAWFHPPQDVNPRGLSVRELVDTTQAGKLAEFLPWVKTVEAMRAGGVTFENPRQKQLVPDYAVTVVGSGFPDQEQTWQREISAYATTQLGVPCEPASVFHFDRALDAASGTPAFDPYEIAERIQAHDALVFDGVPPNHTDQRHLAQLMYEFFSVLVDKNIHPDKKDMLVLVNRDDPRLDILCGVVSLQNEYGLTIDPPMLMQTCGEGDDVVARLKAHWSDYERRPPSVQAHPSDPANRFSVRDELNAGRDHRKPATAILASSKSVAMGVKAETVLIANKVAEGGHDALFGGGTKGLMGEFDVHYRKRVRELDTGGRIAGITTKVVVGKETETGRLSPELDVGHVTTDIVTRMRAMFAADVAVFLAGGVGTSQEVGFGLALKMAGDPLAKDKPMILVNSLMPSGGRLCDGYLEYFGYDDRFPFEDSETRQARGRERLEEAGVYVVEAERDDFDDVFRETFDRACARYGIAA